VPYAAAERTAHYNVAQKSSIILLQDHVVRSVQADEPPARRGQDSAFCGLVELVTYVSCTSYQGQSA
jgi:hypothetical protein